MRVLRLGFLGGLTALVGLLGAGTLSGCAAHEDAPPIGQIRQLERMNLTGFTNDNGLRFNNNFSTKWTVFGFELGAAGLCGGMSYTTLDYFFSGITPPQQTIRPANGTVLYDYIYGRQWNSVMDGPLDNWVGLMGGFSENIFGQSLNGQPGGALRDVFDTLQLGEPFVLSMRTGGGAKSGHQVVAYDIDLHGANIEDFVGTPDLPVTIFVWDPNNPLGEVPDDEMTVGTETKLVHDDTKWFMEHKREKVETDPVGNSTIWYHGFFVDHDYQPQTPPIIVDPPSHPDDGLIHELLLVFGLGYNGSAGEPVDVTVTLVDGSELFFPNVNQGAAWAGSSGFLDEQWISVPLASPLDPAQVKTINVNDNLVAGLFTKNWDLKYFKMYGVFGGPDGVNQTKDMTYNVGSYWEYPDVNDQLFHFDGDPDSLTLATTNPLASDPRGQRGIRIVFKSGPDGLTGSGHNFDATVHFADGTSQTITAMNHHIPWAGGSTHEVMFPLLEEKTLCDLQTLSITAGGNGEHWDVDDMEIYAHGNGPLGSSTLLNTIGADFSFEADGPSTRSVTIATENEILVPPIGLQGASGCSTPTQIQLEVPDITATCVDVSIRGEVVQSNGIDIDPNIPIAADGTVTLGVGQHSVVWYVELPSGAVVEEVVQTVVVTDPIPPEFEPAPPQVIASCEMGPSPVTITPPQVNDNCGAVTITGQATDKDTGQVYDVSAEGWASLPIGRFDVRWNAFDGSSNRAMHQDVDVTSGIDTGSLNIRSRAKVWTPPYGLGRTILNRGTSVSQIGPDAETGSILSVGSLDILDRTTVSGSLISGGFVQKSPTVTHDGLVTQFANLMLPSKVPVPIVAPSLSQGGNVFQYAEYPPVNLTPGTAYQTVSIDRATGVYATAGAYRFQSLSLLDQTGFIEVDLSQGPVTFVVSNNFVLRGELRVIGGNYRDFTVILENGQTVNLEADFTGRLFAVNGYVAVGANTRFRGLMQAGGLRLEDDSTLYCSPTIWPNQDPDPTPDPSDPEPDPGATCQDGIMNGLEAAQDCGGPDCDPCPESLICQPGNGSFCHWNGVCNADGTACQCNQPNFWSSENCSTWHATPEIPDGQFCWPGDQQACNYNGSCNAGGTACQCYQPNFWSSENCSTWHPGPDPN